MGARSRLGFGVSISAPGQDVTSAAGRLLFSTDVRLAQILFEATVEMQTRTFGQTTAPPNYPGVPANSGVTRYFTEGYARFVFPRALPFPPICMMTVVGVEGGVTTYRFATVQYAPAGDSVELFYTYVRDSDPAFSRVAIRVSVLNIPADR